MTAHWRSREELIHQVVVLTAQGMSRRAITRALGVSRNTIKKILRTHGRERDDGHAALAAAPVRAPRSRKIDAYQGRVSELLARYPDITAQRVLEILKDEGFQGGYTAVKKQMRRVRPAAKPTPSLEAPVFGPGEMAENDWSPYTLTYTTGLSETVQLFSYVLVYSKRKSFDVFGSPDLFALMDGHERAFARFGGCAAGCKYDSQKPVVLRWEGHQPIYNPRYLAFAAHYGIQPAAVRGKPNAKPRVERSFWEHERSFLNGRSFRDRDDFAAQLADWLVRVVDPRKRHGLSALDRFRDEAPHLRPLPKHPYDTARVTYRLCSIDGYVEWLGNRYAVPYDHVTDFLPLRITQTELFVYGPNLACLARYELRPRGRGDKNRPARAASSPREPVAHRRRQAARHLRADGRRGRRVPAPALGRPRDPCLDPPRPADPALACPLRQRRRRRRPRARRSVRRARRGLGRAHPRPTRSAPDPRRVRRRRHRQAHR